MACKYYPVNSWGSSYDGAGPIAVLSNLVLTIYHDEVASRLRRPLVLTKRLLTQAVC